MNIWFILIVSAVVTGCSGWRHLFERRSALTIAISTPNQTKPGETYSTNHSSTVRAVEAATTPNISIPSSPLVTLEEAASPKLQSSETFYPNRSQIIIFVPNAQSDELLNTQREINLIKQFKRLLMSFLFFGNPETNEIEFQESNSNDPTKSRRDLGDVMKTAADVVVGASKTVYHVAKDAALDIKEGMKILSKREYPNDSLEVPAQTCLEHCKNENHTCHGNGTTNSHNDDLSVANIKQAKRDLSTKKGNDAPSTLQENTIQGKDTMDGKILPLIRKDAVGENSEIKETLSSLSSKNITDGTTEINNDLNESAPKTNLGDFFRHQDWLWQYLEAMKNESFLQKHHFLCNGGDTKNSTTVTSDSSLDKLENKTMINEVKMDLNKLLEEDELNNANVVGGPLKRVRRIRRNVKHPKKFKPVPSPQKQITDAVLDAEELSLDDNDSLKSEVTNVISTTRNKIAAVNYPSITSTKPVENSIVFSKVTDNVISATKGVKERLGKTVSKLNGDFREMKEEGTFLDGVGVPSKLGGSDSNIGPQHKKTTQQALVDVDEINSSDTISLDGDLPVNKQNRVASKDVEPQWKTGSGGIDTKPLALLVTAPSFIGIGLLIIALCICTRSGGWCCRLFEPQSTVKPTITLPEKEKAEPSPSTQNRNNEDNSHFKQI